MFGLPVKTRRRYSPLVEKSTTLREIRRKCGVKFGDSKTSTGKIIFGGIRSDNEPVLKSALWKEVCNSHNVEVLHSVPYEPQMNSTVERLVGTIKDSLRTTCAYVDPRVWDFAVEHIMKVWCMRKSPRASKCLSCQGSSCSPNDVLKDISENPLV